MAIPSNTSGTVRSLPDDVSLPTACTRRSPSAPRGSVDAGPPGPDDVVAPDVVGVVEGRPESGSRPVPVKSPAVGSWRVGVGSNGNQPMPSSHTSGHACAC